MKYSWIFVDRLYTKIKGNTRTFRRIQTDHDGQKDGVPTTEVVTDIAPNAQYCNPGDSFSSLSSFCTIPRTIPIEVLDYPLAAENYIRSVHGIPYVASPYSSKHHYFGFGKVADLYDQHRVHTGL